MKQKEPNLRRACKGLICALWNFFHAVSANEQDFKENRHYTARGLVTVSRCEISRIALDYYYKPTQHHMACHDLDTGDIVNLIPPSKDVLRPESGDVLTLLGTPIPSLSDMEPDTMLVHFWFARRRRKIQRQRALQFAGSRSAVAMIVRFTTADGILLGTAMNTSRNRYAYARTVRNTLFGNPDSSNLTSHADAWRQCSYHKATLEADSDGLSGSLLTKQYFNESLGDDADVYYVDIPSTCNKATDPNCLYSYDMTQTCNVSSTYFAIAMHAMNKLEDEITGFSSHTYQHKVIVFDTTNTNCNFVGLGTIGCSSTYCFTLIPHSFCDRVSSYLHEMGHNLGLMHAGSAEYMTGTTDSEYADLSDAMGYCCTERCYNGPHAYQLGWLNATELRSYNISSSTNYTINSMSKTNVGSLISITADWNTGDGSTYWIQLKTAASYDQYASANWLNNIQIKQWNKGNFMLTVDQGVKLLAGQSWIDPSGKVHVFVQSIDVVGGSAAVNVGWAPPPYPTIAPTYLPTNVPSILSTKARWRSRRPSWSRPPRNATSRHPRPRRAPSRSPTQAPLSPIRASSFAPSFAPSFSTTHSQDLSEVPSLIPTITLAGLANNSEVNNVVQNASGVSNDREYF